MSENNKPDLKSIIKDHQDFPKKGILFRDINPVFRNYEALESISKSFLEEYEIKDIDLIAGIESRGFVVATALANRIKRGVLMIRKVGKLPGNTVKKQYEIEYGEATMEIQQDSVLPGQRVIIADDLIATGGTAMAAAELVEQLGGKVAFFAFVIDLVHLSGSQKLKDKGYEVRTLVNYYE